MPLASEIERREMVGGLLLNQHKRAERDYPHAVPVPGGINSAPFNITIDAEGSYPQKQMHDWLRENGICGIACQKEVPDPMRHHKNIPQSYETTVYFRRAEEAVAFKLRWA